MGQCLVLSNSGSVVVLRYLLVLPDTGHLHQGGMMSVIEPKDLSQESAHPVHELGQHAHTSIEQ